MEIDLRRFKTCMGTPKHYFMYECFLCLTLPYCVQGSLELLLDLCRDLVSLSEGTVDKSKLLIVSHDVSLPRLRSRQTFKHNWSARCQYNVTGWASMWAYDMLSQ